MVTSFTGTVVLTGANGGLGSAIVQHIVSSPDLSASLHGVYTVRDLETSSGLKSALNHGISTHNHESIALDLGRLSDVRKATDAINQRVESGAIPPIRALILNAGYQEQTIQTYSDDGFDASFQCNYLSHWLFTLRLLKSMDKQHGRIIVIGSCTHDPNHPGNQSIGMFEDEKWKTIFHDTESLATGTWSTTEDDPSLKGGFRRYGAAKLCEIMMVYELQRRLDKDPDLSNICVLGIDPGGMPSGLIRRSGFVMYHIIGKIVLPIMAYISGKFSPNGPLRTTAKSASDVIRAAFDDNALGKYPKALYLNGTDISESSPESRDRVKQAMLWRDSVKLVKLTADETVLAEWD